jgi:para-aminobenzoate synthetase component 1
MFNFKLLKGLIESIHLEQIDLNESFIDFSARFASLPGTVILMSGGNLDCARFHIIATRPWLSFSGRGSSMNISIDNESYHFEADPFDTLRMLLNNYSIDMDRLHRDLPFPVSAGLFGYLSYDLKDNLEGLPRTSLDDLCLPHICLFAPSIIIIHDKIENSTSLCVPQRIVSGRSNLDDNLEFFNRIVSSDPPQSGTYSGGAEGFRSNFIKTDYMDTIDKIKEYIASGHVYQVNMSQRFEMDFEGDPFNLFKTLYNNNPAPFFAFIQAGDYQIVSTSPERFIQRTGRQVETRPIKGTRPRGASPEEDKRLCHELMESKKDDAELSMIVDLLRNDLGKVCTGGTVRVTEHKRLETYQNVYHLLSIVEGVLDDSYDSVDLIAATFPGGSITGCPKIRSMEIIDELEPNRRHIYTGSIGYISFHETMDLSIAIRTATILNNKMIFSAGGGVVFDSDPEDEFDETLHKGRTLMDVFQGKEKRTENKIWAWINGTIKPMDQVLIPVADPGFQYGYGFFETIRVDKGEIKYLEEHMDRFNQTMKQLFSQDPPDVTWGDIIHQVVRRNGPEEETAAVKVIATKGDRDVSPYNNIFIVTARPYTHRLSEKKEPGLNIATYPEPRQTPLAHHKTLNYLYYFMAGKWADTRGADEALILNPDATISETNTGNILLIKDKKVLTPASPHVLPGTMEKIILKCLEEWSFKITDKSLMPEDLYDADLVMITNSLMGAVPMLSLDGKKLARTSDLWRKINDAVL